MSGALEAVSLRRSFGGVVALDRLDISVDQGEVRGVIGPNGAGKTTLLNVLSGLVRPTEGRVLREGRDVTGWPADRMVRQARLVRTFQTVRLFSSMTVEENVLIAARRGADAESRARAWLERLGLLTVAAQPARELAFGLQRSVELARALASEPEVLLLDEPAAGLNPRERDALARLIREVSGEGVTVVLVEHQMDLVMSACDAVTVLDFGRVICEGTPRAAVDDARVREAYLGPAGMPVT